MQISDVITDDFYTNNTYRSMLPLIWILKIFALNYNLKQTVKSSSILLKSFCTSSIIGSIHFYCLYFKINYLYPKTDLSVKLTDMVQIISDYCQYIVDLCFVYKYGRHICVEYFKQYEKIDKFLNVTCYPDIKRKIIKLMAFLITIWIISSFGDLGAWFVAYGWMAPATHTILFVLFFTKILTTLDMISHITQIEYRLRILCSLTQYCYSIINTSHDVLTTDCVHNKNWLYNNDNKKTHSDKVRLNDSQEIKRLTRCYLLLTEQVAFVNRMYGFRIMLNTLSLLLDMVKVTNLAIRVVIGTERTVFNTMGCNYLPGISALLRLLTCAAILISLVYRCEQAYSQRRNIINVIDHLLVIKNPDDELRSSITDLRTLIQDRPICFNMANFATLNCSLLVSVASVVVTYTIILLQNVN